MFLCATCIDSRYICGHRVIFVLGLPLHTRLGDLNMMKHAVPQSRWSHLVDRRGEHTLAAPGPAGEEAVVVVDADVVVAVPALAVDLSVGVWPPDTPMLVRLFRQMAAAVAGAGADAVVATGVKGPPPRRRRWRPPRRRWRCPRHVSRRPRPRLRGGRRVREGRMSAAPGALGAGLLVGQRHPGALRPASAGGAHLRRRRAGSTFLQGVTSQQIFTTTNRAEGLGAKQVTWVRRRRIRRRRLQPVGAGGGRRAEENGASDERSGARRRNGGPRCGSRHSCRRRGSAGADLGMNSPVASWVGSL
jgi:hypothetical protein